MTQITWHVEMSLDGYIAGPDHAMEWAFGRGPAGPIADDVMRSTGAILAGRRWYDVATERYDGRAGIYGGRWSGPVFVLTHRPPADPHDPEITFLSGDVADAVDVARGAAGAKNVEIFGAQTARQCLEAGLVDEIVVHVAPVLLGDGVRLYDGDGAAQVELERVDAHVSPQLTSMRFRVKR